MAELPTFDNDLGLSFNADGSGNFSTTFVVGANNNRVLVVALSQIGSSTAGSVSYAGSGFTKIDTAQAPSSGPGTQTHILIGPATGSNSLSFSGLGAGSQYLMTVHSYYNCRQSNQPDNHTIASNSGGGSATLTPNVDNCMFWGGVMQADSATEQNSGFPNHHANPNNGSNQRMTVGDNGVITPPSSQSATYAGTQRAVEFAMSIAPFNPAELSGTFILPIPNYVIDRAIEIIAAPN